MLNLYCDESNHLMHSTGKVMTLGYVQANKLDAKRINRELREIKIKHGLSHDYELKWTKVSRKMLPYYKELIDYFFLNEDLKFRCVLANKEDLDLSRFGFTPDDWYYRMYYLLLGKTLEENREYNIYVDIKDTCGYQKVKELRDVLMKSYYDFSETMIKKIQLVHSHELEVLQLTDLFIGAIGYNANHIRTSEAKLSVISYLEEKSSLKLDETTPRYKSKFNLFYWEGK